MMNLRRTLVLFMAACLYLTTHSWAQGQARIQLRELNLPSGTPLSVLPGDALVHLQMNQPMRTLERVEGFLKKTFPEKVLPPEQRGLLQHPHPLLLAAGIQLPPDQPAEQALSAILGVNPTQPWSLTLYAGDPWKSYILSLPVDDVQQFERGMVNAIRPKNVEEISVGGRTLLKVQTEVGPRPVVYMLYGGGRVYVGGEPFLLRHLHDQRSFPRLGEDPLFEKSISMSAQDELALVLNPKVLKPLLPTLNYLRFVPLQLLSKYRSELLNQIPEPVKVAVNQQIRTQYGIRDLDQLADYAECILTATYEELLNLGLGALEEFEGVSWSSSMKEGVFSDTLTLYSQGYRSDDLVSPIPVASVASFLSRYSGSKDHIQIEGRKSPSKPSHFALSWMDRLLGMLKDRQLKSEWLDTMKKDYLATPRLILDGELGDWKLDIRAQVRKAPSPADYMSVSDYWFDLMKESQKPFDRQVTVMPGVAPEQLVSTWEKNAETKVFADHLGRQRAEEWMRQPGILTGFARVHSDQGESGILDVRVESGLTTTFGLFGFDQHEWVNRRHYQIRKMGDYLVYHRGSGDGNWLKELDLTRSGVASMDFPVEIPSGARCVSVHRFHNHLFEVVDWMGDMEKLMDREARNYLDAIVSQAGAEASKESLSTAAEGIRIPEFLYGVGRDSESGQLYGLLPGRFVFPRPSFADFLQEIIRDFKADAGRRKGGLMSVVRVEDNMKQIQMAWNPSALSSFVKNVGNHLAEHYLNQGGPDRIVNRIRVEKDMSNSINDELIYRNPRWVMLDQVPVFNPPRPKVDSKPGHAIPERSADCTPNQIDLSNHYNASLRDVWHQGGLEGNDLSNLGSGLKKLAGVQFDVRGIVQLTGLTAEQQLTVRFPELVREIPVNRTFNAIHLLHGTGWNTDHGSQVAMLQLYYEDGTTAELPIVYGQHVVDWWTQDPNHSVEKSAIAWEGSNGASVGSGIPLRLYRTTWSNPNPAKQVKYMDYISMNTGSAPFMIAATVE